MNTIQTISYTLTHNSELFSVLLMCLFVALLTALLFRFLPERPKNAEHTGIPVPQGLQPVFRSYREPAALRKQDAFAMVLITALYAVTSLHMLGSSAFPETVWQPTAEDQSIVFELPEDTAFEGIYLIYTGGDNNANPTGRQAGLKDITLSGSNDLVQWTAIGEPADNAMFHYSIMSGDWDWRYVLLHVGNRNDTINEIGFRRKGDTSFLPVKIQHDDYASSSYPADLLIDEQDTLTAVPTYMNEGYFDEIYHPRNAVEIANGQYMYPQVHPLFGTTLIALSIRLLGNNPLAWRLPGAITGAAMIPLFYLILKLLFRRRFLAIFGSGLLATEFMHYTTSRIATLEPFSVFLIVLMYYFMMRYFLIDSYHAPLKQRLMLLLACGISFGFAGATKWTAFYSAAGLAVIFFVHFGIQIRFFLKARNMLEDYPDENSEEHRFLDHYVSTFRREWTITIALCFVFFIFLPVIIYFASYLPTKVWRDGYSIKNVISQIRYIYTYHIDLDATHPYQSTWKQWIVDARPIWYYYGTDAEGLRHTIACFTNPLLTWTGLFTILYVFLCIPMRHSRTAFLIAVGYLSAILPWIAVTRCVFAYHFYPTSIFMLMSIVYFANDLRRTVPHSDIAIRLFLLASIAFFIYFLPVISGFGTDDAYIKMAEWFSSWYFG